jgi:hypothetical protein
MQHNEETANQPEKQQPITTNSDILVKLSSLSIQSSTLDPQHDHQDAKETKAIPDFEPTGSTPTNRKRKRFERSLKEFMAHQPKPSDELPLFVYTDKEGYEHTADEIVFSVGIRGEKSPTTRTSRKGFFGKPEHHAPGESPPASPTADINALAQDVAPALKIS